MKAIFKSTGYYFLILQLHVLATVAINVFAEFVLAFITKDLLWTLSLKVALGLVSELLLCYFFVKKQVGKRTVLKEIALPFALALLLHFLLALANTFYIYTAGAAANNAALLWESAVRGEAAVMADVAMWRRILTFLPTKALVLLAASLGYRAGRKGQNLVQEKKTDAT